MLKNKKMNKNKKINFTKKRYLCFILYFTTV